MPMAIFYELLSVALIGSISNKIKLHVLNVPGLSYLFARSAEMSCSLHFAPHTSTLPNVQHGTANHYNHV